MWKDLIFAGMLLAIYLLIDAAFHMMVMQYLSHMGIYAVIDACECLFPAYRALDYMIYADHENLANKLAARTDTGSAYHHLCSLVRSSLII